MINVDQAFFMKAYTCSPTSQFLQTMYTTRQLQYISLNLARQMLGFDMSPLINNNL